MENAGNTGLQQKSKEALFPEATNYRYVLILLVFILMLFIGIEGMRSA
jgi:hypothetical protein